MKFEKVFDFTFKITLITLFFFLITELRKLSANGRFSITYTEGSTSILDTRTGEVYNIQLKGLDIDSTSFDVKRLNKALLK